MTIRPNPKRSLALRFRPTLAAPHVRSIGPRSAANSRPTCAPRRRSEIFVAIPKGNLAALRALPSRWRRTSGQALRPSDFQLAMSAEAVLTQCVEIIERINYRRRALPAPSGAIDLLKALIAKGATSSRLDLDSSLTVARWLEIHRVSDLVTRSRPFTSFSRSSPLQK